MKLIYNRSTTAALMLPIFLLVAAGCDKNGNSGGDTNSMAAGMTNSASANDGMTNADSMATNSGMIKADNSRNNMQDRDTNNLTALDQGNSPADLNLTQQIRKSVVSSTNNFSMMAQNIKIITVNGKVTLRGPVQNDMEKSNIDMIAKNAAGEGNVDDQLEVKSNP